MNKIIETFDVNDWEVTTELGWTDITHTNKTIEFDVYELKIKGYDEPLRCADNHIVFKPNHIETFVKDLKSGDLVITATGSEVVEYVKSLGYKETMYDLSVKGQRYLINGILSHNTTIVAIFGLHYSMFNKDKTVAILAQQLDGAIEMIDRIKVMLEELPKFMRPGVKTYNKKSIVFENGCKIIANATTAKAVRGKAINCQTGNAIVTIKDNVTGEIEKLTFEELEQRLIALQNGLDPNESIILNLKD